MLVLAVIAARRLGQRGMRLATTLTATAFPLYATFKTLEAPSHVEAHRRWLVYWLCLSILAPMEGAVDSALALVPNYSFAKLSALVWLQRKGRSAAASRAEQSRAEQSRAVMHTSFVIHTRYTRISSCTRVPGATQARHAAPRPKLNDSKLNLVRIPGDTQARHATLNPKLNDLIVVVVVVYWISCAGFKCNARPRDAGVRAEFKCNL